MARAGRRRFVATIEDFRSVSIARPYGYDGISAEDGIVYGFGREGDNV